MALISWTYVDRTATCKFIKPNLKKFRYYGLLHARKVINIKLRKRGKYLRRELSPDGEFRVYYYCSRVEEWGTGSKTPTIKEKKRAHKWGRDYFQEIRKARGYYDPWVI